MGLKKKSNKYAIIVKEIMAKHGVKLPKASKYINENISSARNEFVFVNDNIILHSILLWIYEGS